MNVKEKTQTIFEDMMPKIIKIGKTYSCVEYEIYMTTDLTEVARRLFNHGKSIAKIVEHGEITGTLDITPISCGVRGEEPRRRANRDGWNSAYIGDVSNF